MATRSKQASEARADFWLRAEAEAEAEAKAKALRYGRRAARGSRLQQQERWCTAAVPLAVHADVRCSGSQKGLSKKPSKRGIQNGKGRHALSFWRSAAEKGLPASQRAIDLPHFWLPRLASPRLNSGTSRQPSEFPQALVLYLCSAGASCCSPCWPERRPAELVPPV